MQLFLEKHFSPSEKILLACSAGPDSMYLLYKILETSFAANLVVCYFNHKLRPESDDEEKFLEELAKKKGFTVEIASANMRQIHENFYQSISLEELCRKKRYDFFDAIMHIYDTDKILLAHHLDDKIETFFFNLARGSKLTGLINMTQKSGKILRPLLHLTKSEILDYLHSCGLEYKIDNSNFQDDFTRNKIRNRIIPQFFDINSNFKKNISQTLDYFEDIKSFIDTEVINFLAKNDGFFDIRDFLQLSEFLQKEVVRYIFYVSNNGSTIGLTASNIEEILRFIRGKNNKTKKEIRNMKLFKDNTKIIYKNPF